MTASQAKSDNEYDMCGQHGQFLSDISWLKNYTKIILGLVGASAIVLCGIFGSIVKFGWEMSISSQLMQKELARLAGDVVELKESDKKICKEIQDMKKRRNGIMTEREPWSE